MGIYSKESACVKRLVQSKKFQDVFKNFGVLTGGHIFVPPQCINNKLAELLEENEILDVKETDLVRKISI